MMDIIVQLFEHLNYLKGAASPSCPHWRVGGDIKGMMAPLLARNGVVTPSTSLTQPPLPIFLTTTKFSSPSHPKQSMEGSIKGLMAPLPTKNWEVMPLISLAHPPSLTCLTTTALSPAPSWPTTTERGPLRQNTKLPWHFFCWVRHIQLSCWFIQQRWRHLQALSCSALACTVSAWGNCWPPPTPTDNTSNPKVLRHLFWIQGLPIPWRRQAWRYTCPHGPLGWKNHPRAPEDGGGLLCMPFCFWATQTAVAALDLCAGIGWSSFKLYLPPIMAATVIQNAYCA